MRGVFLSRGGLGVRRGFGGIFLFSDVFWLSGITGEEG